MQSAIAFEQHGRRTRRGKPRRWLLAKGSQGRRRLRQGFEAYEMQATATVTPLDGIVALLAPPKAVALCSPLGEQPARRLASARQQTVFDRLYFVNEIPAHPTDVTNDERKQPRPAWLRASPSSVMEFYS